MSVLKAAVKRLFFVRSLTPFPFIIMSRAKGAGIMPSGLYQP